VGYETALILSGGRGTRLGRVGEILPKCLVPVFDQLLLVRHIEQCRRAGARRVFVSISKASYPVLQAVIEQLAPDGIEISCIVEDEPLGASGGFLACHERIGDAGTIVVLGDVYVTDDASFDAFARVPAHDIMLSAIHTADPARIQCNVQVDAGGRVVGVIDRATPEQLRGDLRWDGPFALAPGVFSRCRRVEVDAHGYLGTMLDKFLRAGITIGAVELREPVLNLNTIEDVLLASLLDARGYFARTRPQSVLDHHLERLIDELDRR
jgi:dTDP-glucose pyrophosphorylase